MNVMYYTDVDEHTSGLNFSKSRKPIQTVHRARTEYHGPRDSNLSKPSLIVLRVPKPLRIWTDSMLALNHELSRKSSLESHVLRESHTSIIFRSTPNASCSNGTSIRATTGCNNITACFCCPWMLYICWRWFLNVRQKAQQEAARYGSILLTASKFTSITQIFLPRQSLP